MIVRIREACPGQSTRVNCRLSYCCWPPLSRRWSGRPTVNEEKPRSSVIPLSRDCGFLSKAAVDAVLLSALASEVFPLSTCPSTPTLKFNVLVWLSADSDIVTAVRNFLYSELDLELSTNGDITRRCLLSTIFSAVGSRLLNPEHLGYLTVQVVWAFQTDTTTKQDFRATSACKQFRDIFSDVNAFHPPDNTLKRNYCFS